MDDTEAIRVEFTGERYVADLVSEYSGMIMLAVADWCVFVLGCI